MRSFNKQKYTSTITFNFQQSSKKVFDLLFAHLKECYGKYLNNTMLGKNIFERSRGSSKSYKSTSPSAHFSPRHSESRLSSACIIPETINYQASSLEFMDNNEKALRNLHKVMIDGESLLQKHKEWCNKVALSISSNFANAKNMFINFLNQQQCLLKDQLEQQYVNFIKLFSQLKDGIRQMYNKKPSIERPQYKKSTLQIQEYYGGIKENKVLLNQLQRENDEREDFRSVNEFYKEKKRTVEKLNHQALYFFSLQRRLQMIQEQNIQSIEQFLGQINQAIGKMKTNRSQNVY